MFTHHLVLSPHESREPLVAGGGVVVGIGVAVRRRPRVLVLEKEFGNVLFVQARFVMSVPRHRRRHGQAVTVGAIHDQYG